MPVTAKLSSRFYEKLGDDVTNELVTWLNAVDAEFRSELREANDRNWSQLRAELDAQSARLTAEFRGGLAELRTEMQTGFANIRGEFASVRGEMAAGLADGRTGLADLRADLRVEIHQESTKLIRWMFGFWVMTVLTIAGLKLL
jgi:hypothetical protein